MLYTSLMLIPMAAKNWRVSTLVGFGFGVGVGVGVGVRKIARGQIR